MGHLFRRRLHMRFAHSRHLLAVRPGIYPMGSVETGAVDHRRVVDHRVVNIGVVNDRPVHVQHCGVVGKVSALPTAAIETGRHHSRSRSSLRRRSQRGVPNNRHARGKHRYPSPSSRGSRELQGVAPAPRFQEPRSSPHPHTPSSRASTDSRPRDKPAARIPAARGERWSRKERRLQTTTQARRIPIDARNRVLRARIGRIALLLASPRSNSACESSLPARAAGTICINAMPRIMLLASHRKVTSGNPTVLRVSTMCVGGYPTFAARGPAEQSRKLGSFRRQT